MSLYISCFSLSLCSSMNIYVYIYVCISYDLFVHHDTECVISWEALRVVGMTCFTAPPLPVLGPDGQVVFEPVSVLRVGVPIVLPPPPLPPMPVKREKDIVKKEMKQEKVAETCCDGEEKGEGVVKVEPVEVKKENVAGKTEGVVKEETLIVKKETRHTMIVKKEMKQEKVAETCCDGEEKGEGVVKIEPVGVKKEKHTEIKEEEREVTVNTETQTQEMIVKKEARQDKVEKVEGGVKLEPVEVKRENGAVKTEGLGTYSPAQRAALVAVQLALEKRDTAVI